MNGKAEGESVVGLIIAYNFKEAEEKLLILAKQVNKLPAGERSEFIKEFGAELGTAVEIGIQEDVIEVLTRTLFR